jgi:hypothetical protein
MIVLLEYVLNAGRGENISVEVTDLSLQNKISNFFSSERKTISKIG